MEALLFVLFCITVVVGLLFIFKVTELSRTLQILEVEVHDLSRRLDTLAETLPKRHAETSARTAAPAPAASGLPAEGRPEETPSLAGRLTEEMLTIEHQVEVERGAVTGGVPPGAPIGPEPARPAPAAPLPPGPPLKPSRTREEWEQLIGGKLLNRIGALALIIGVGFFLKYAFDNNWLSETFRVLIGTVVGIVLLGGAAWFRKKGLPIFAQGLVGAGIAILYLSVYASFNFYHLVAQPTAFVLMAAVTVIAFTQAFAYDSLAASLLGWAGGFLTPFLLSTGQANEAGLFTYVALLDAGLLVVIMKRQAWQVLHPLTAGATFLIYALWHQEFYRAEAAGLTVFFIVLLWALFLVLDVFGRPRPAPAGRLLHELVGIANGVFLYFAVLAVLHETLRPLYGAAIACMAFLYGLAAFAAARAVPGERVRLTRLLLTAVALATIAIATEYTEYTVVILWALGAAVLLRASLRWNSTALTVASVVLYGITGAAVLALPKTYAIEPAQFRLMLNMRVAGLLVYALALASAPGVLTRMSAKWRGSADLFRCAWAAVLFLLLTGEVNDLFRQWHAGAAGGPDHTVLSFYHYLTLAGVWTAAGLLLAVFGSRRTLTVMRGAGGAMLVVAMALLGSTVLRETLPQGVFSFLNLRVLVVILTAGVALFFARSLPFGVLVRSFWHYAAYLLLFFLLLAECGDWLGAREAAARGEEAEHFEYLFWMLIAGVWALYGLALAYTGRRTGTQEPAWAGLASLAAAFVAASVQGIAYVPVTWFTPFVNFRFVSLAVVIASLTAGGWAVGGLDGKPFAWVRRSSSYVALFLLLLLLTAETRDLFERLIAITERAGGAAVAQTVSRLENLKQLCLSVIWLLVSVGLMGVGLFYRNRPLRLTAIGLLGFTILKIFLYDLSFLETLYRIFSFIGLGIILLAASYVYQRNKELILGHGGQKIPTV